MREKMDSEQGQKQVGRVSQQERKSKKQRPFRLFFLNGHLHKVLSVTRGQDLITAWDFVDHKRNMYVLSDVRRRMQSAYNITEVARMLNRSRITVDRYIRREEIRTPQRVYNISTRRPGMYWFSEDDVLDCHEYISSLHIGRPRNDGQITTWRVPTREEIKALVKQDVILYTKDNDGNFVPVWKEQRW